MKRVAMRWVVYCLVCVWLVSVSRRAAAAEEPLWLVREGRARAAIVFGGNNGFAAERLQRFVKERSGAEQAIVPADRWKPPTGSRYARRTPGTTFPLRPGVKPMRSSTGFSDTPLRATSPYDSEGGLGPRPDVARAADRHAAHRLNSDLFFVV